MTHKGQTRIWGYKIKMSNAEDEFTKVMIDAPQTRDPNDRPGQISPVESARAWEGEAEENLLLRLERAGLLAPEGEVDAVLQTVVSNLEITNELNIQPPVRCRVLLTTPLESFTIGHTIVLSRGLIDVLPDEASLAMVLAHELGHVLSGHELDTKYAFSDQMLVGDKQAMQQFVFQRDPAEETQADDRAVELLQNSPYKDDLDNPGLFLKALSARAADLPALIRPHFGNRLAKHNELYRMNGIIDAAPELDPTSVEQTAALPLGGRVKLDPWSASIELMTDNRVPLLSAREKLEFQITPLMPYLARYAGQPVRAQAAPDSGGERVASDNSRVYP
ncbi:MAG: M48 family metalloprotease [bacterium]|nr:M48 family metalloprotease [bacterium]